MNEHKEPIPSMLYNAAVGGHVTNSQQIIDENENKEQSQINTEIKEALGAGGSVDNRIAEEGAKHYLKEETYSKSELNNMITTPNQKYVSFTATAETTAVTDVLPVTGAADTIYRVGNWDGTQYNDSVFSEYAWNGSAYIKLSTKSQIGEVYDISANHANIKYENLAAALDGGNNIPKSIQKGGISIKFIQSSDNKYVQYRLMSDTFNTIPTNWQGIDDEPTVGSNNLVKSEGVYANQLNRLFVNGLPYIEALHLDGVTYHNNYIITISSGSTALGCRIYKDSNPITANLIGTAVFQGTKSDDTWTLTSTKANINEYGGSGLSGFIKFNTNIVVADDIPYRITNLSFLNIYKEIEDLNDNVNNVEENVSSLLTLSSEQQQEIDDINNVSIPKLGNNIVNIGSSIGNYESNENVLIPISTGVGYPRLDKQQIYYDENFSYGIFDVSQYLVIAHTFYGMTNLSVFSIALSNDVEMTNNVKYIAYTKEQGEQNVDVVGYKYLAVIVSYKGTERTSVFGTIFVSTLKKEVENIKKNELSNNYIKVEPNRTFVGGYPRLDKSSLYGSGYIVGIYQLGLGIRYRLEFSAINTQYNCVGFSDSDNASAFDYVMAYPSTDGIIDIESDKYKYAYVLLSKEGNTHIYNIVYKYISKYDAALRATKKLNGKTIWTLGDSLCHNTWQEYFKEISGCDWDAELNIKSDAPISFGGTKSLPNEDDGAQGRALNLAKYIGIKSIDYIFVENVNDIAYLSSTYLGTIDNKSFMRKQNITINPTTDITNNAEAQAYFRNNFSSIVESIDSTKRIKGTMISIPISGTSINGSKITFEGTVTTEGDITIVCGGINYAVHVTIGMSVQNVIDEFIKYSFGQGIKDIDNGDGSMSIFSTSSPSIRVTNVNVGNTGISASISEYAGTTPQRVFFMGDIASEFTDISNWSFICTLYSAYKGLIEYLQLTFSNAKIYWFLPYSMNVDFNSNEYKNGDGSWSQDKFKQSNHYQWMSHLREVQIEVCKYYNLPFLDLFKESGMSINNIQTYFKSNNVHPNAIGYNRYAETILRLI